MDLAFLKQSLEQTLVAKDDFVQEVCELLNIPLSRCFTTPFLRVSGTRDVWRISTLGSALGFVLIGQVRQKETQNTARRFCRK